MRSSFFLFNKSQYGNFVKFNQSKSFFGLLSIRIFDIFFKDVDLFLLRNLNYKYELHQLNQTTNFTVINYFDMIVLKTRSYVFLFLLFLILISFFYSYAIYLIIFFFKCIFGIFSLLANYILFFFIHLLLQVLFSFV